MELPFTRLQSRLFRYCENEILPDEKEPEDVFFRKQLSITEL